MCADPKQKIAFRAAQEILSGQVINLGIGIPTLIPTFLSPDISVTIHSENGIIGAGGSSKPGDADRNLIDAGGTYITTVPGASFCDSAQSFALIRGGRLDISFLGALELSATGDLANWIIPGKFAPGIGGAMELAQKAKRLIITTTHVTSKGVPKILRTCKLPLTAPGCVDLIITELAVIRVSSAGLVLEEIALETDLDTVVQLTDAPLKVSEKLTTF